MQWSEKHDTLLMREILLFEPWEQRYGSPERGLVWKQIADSLTSYEEAKFKILDSRSVRDRYKALVKKYKKKSEELCASGISPEHTELDDAIHNAIQRFDEADKLHKQATKHKKEKLEQEAAQATEMRNMSLESFGETRKRKKSNDEEQEYKRKKIKSTGSDTFAYQREKACSDEKLKKEEMELRKLEASANREQQQEIMKHLTESQKQHQNTMQQFMQMQQQQTTTMMQQQQQLNVALLTVLQKFAPSGR